MSDVEHRFVQFFRAVGIFVENIGGRLRRVREFVVRLVGIRVGSHIRIVVIICTIVCFVSLFAVGRNPCHSLVFFCGIYFVVPPRILVVIDVQDEQSATGDFLVPTRPLAVFEQEIFVAVAFIINNIGVAAVLQRLHTRHLGVFGQFDGLFPTCHPTLVTREACRTETLTVVCASIHQIPVAHPRILVVCVVEVGIAETMAELVANGADSVDFPTRGFARVIIVVGLKFVATSVGVDGDAVEFERARAVAVIVCI